MTKYMKFETEDGEFFVRVDETALPEEQQDETEYRR